MGKPLFSVPQFLAAIPGTGGIITMIAERVGCTWNTAQKYIKDHPTVTAAYANECEKVKDMAESKLIASMNEGDLESIKWYLARKAKDRGYSPGVEVTGKDGGAFKQEVQVTVDGISQSILAKLLPELAGRGAAETPGEVEPG